jgi:hypothetical protein
MIIPATIIIHSTVLTPLSHEFSMSHIVVINLNFS